MFYEIVRKLPEGAQVVLEATGDRATLAIRAGRSRFTLQTLPESDFPDLAAGEMTHTFKLAAADLKRLIDKTQFAISTEETRYYLNGIYLHTAGTAKAPTLRGVATDGHRLAQFKLSLSNGKLMLSVTNPDSGSATEEIEVEYGSEPLDIGFNSRYLLDIAAQLEGEAAVLKLADPGSPTLIQDRDTKGALYVLMPMRV